LFIEADQNIFSNKAFAAILLVNAGKLKGNISVLRERPRSAAAISMDSVVHDRSKCSPYFFKPEGQTDYLREKRSIAASSFHKLGRHIREGLRHLAYLKRFFVRRIAAERTLIDTLANRGQPDKTEHQVESV
jgi:hypothetical protein